MQTQSFNEALIKLCILLYQIDGKVTLNEQEYLAALEKNIDWQGEQELETFHAVVIHQVREAIDQGKVRAYLSGLRSALAQNAKKALTVAHGLAFIDGDLDESERELLDFLEHRLLAKSLNQKAA